MPSQTWKSDKLLTVDSHVLHGCAATLNSITQSRHDRTRVLVFTLTVWALEFSKAAVAVQVEGVGPVVLRQLRHKSASRKLRTNTRDLVGPLKQGRWQTGALLRRYEKSGRLAKQISNTPIQLG